MRNHARDLLGRLMDATVYDWIGLLALVAVAGWFVFRIRSRYLGGDDPAAGDHQLLSGLMDLKREGSLTEEEYRNIKGQIARRIDGPRRQNVGGTGHPEVSSVDREVDTDG